MGRTPADSGTAKPLRNWQWTVDWIVAAGLVLLVAVAYLQVLRFEFVNYDDTVYVPETRRFARDSRPPASAGPYHF